MKFFFKICLLELLVTSIALADYPKEHRGFYFSFGSGFSYYNAKYSETTSYQKEEHSFSGFSFVSMDFRFGRAIANAVALYADFNLALPQGYLEATTYERNEKYADWSLYEDISTWKDVFSFSGGGGLGIEVYPCRYPRTFWRGIHFGNAILLDHSISNILNKDASFELIGLAWRTSSGLDWWVNDTWSIGIEVAQISQIWAQDVNDFTNQKFQILFRITHR